MASKRFRDAVGIDPDRVISAAVDAALGETQHNSQKKHHPGRVLVAGAVVAGAAWAGQKRMPRLAKMPLKMGMHKLGNKLGDMTHVDDLADSLRDRLSGHEDEPDEDYYEDEEEFDDEPRDEEFDDEPRDEGDEEEFDDEDDEGFDDEDDRGFDDEPEDGDGPRGEGDEIDDEEVDDEEVDDEELDDDEVEDVSEPDEDEPEPDDEELEPDEDEPEPDDEELEPDEDDEEIAARSLELGVRSQTARDIDPATRPPEPDERRPRRRSNNKQSKAARA